MASTFKKSHVPQNLSLVDRLFRLVLGLAMMSVLFYSNPYLVLSTGWESVIALLGIYPLMTGMVGVDPIYQLGHLSSCDTSERNQCGTLPYQIAASIDHIPGVCDSDTEHSLDACHPVGEPKPHHKVWHVD